MKKIIGIIILIICIFSFLKFFADNTSKNNKKTEQTQYNKLSKNEKDRISEKVKNVKVKYNTKFKVKGIKKIEGIKGIYIRDIDGDTIMVKVNNNEEKVRFLMVDTPETVKRGTPIEPYGLEAKEFVKERLSKGEEVTLVTGRDEKDKYGRVLAYIYYKENGLWYNLNEELVANGFARVAYVYDKKDSLLPQMYEAENSAKNQKINIWSIPNYVTNTGYNLEIVG